jgi:hypothetical protein
LLYGRGPTGRLEAEVDTAADALLELDQAAEGSERLEVLFAVEGGEHSCLVAEGCDLRADALAERLTPRRPPEVVIAARAGRLRNDLQLARVGIELEKRQLLEIALGRRQKPKSPQLAGPSAL